MANAERGEASFELNGKTYTVKANMLGWAETQDVLRRHWRRPTEPIEQIGAQVDAGSLIHLIAVFFGFTRRYHSVDIPTVERAAEIMELAGEDVGMALRAAMESATAKGTDVAQLNDGKGRPPAAQETATPPRGTGTRSSTRRAASV